MKYKCLQHSTDEHQSCNQKPPPGWGILVLDEADQDAVFWKIRKGKGNPNKNNAASLVGHNPASLGSGILPLPLSNH